MVYKNSNQNEQVIKGRIIPASVLEERQTKNKNFGFSGFQKWLCKKLKSVNCFKLFSNQEKRRKNQNEIKNSLELTEKIKKIEPEALNNSNIKIIDSFEEEDYDFYDDFSLMSSNFELDVNNQIRQKKSTSQTFNEIYENSTLSTKMKPGVSFAILFGDLTLFSQDNQSTLTSIEADSLFEHENDTDIDDQSFSVDFTDEELNGNGEISSVELTYF